MSKLYVGVDWHKRTSTWVAIWEEGLGIVKESVLQADYWTTFSRYTEGHAKNVFPQITSCVIYGGVDLELINTVSTYRNQCPYFFTARRLEHSKGLDILIRAFAKISIKLPSYELIVAGDGIERENLENLAKSLSAKVKFIGAIDQSSVFSFMKGAVAHICPSRSESGGLVNYEAQAAGCIAIGSNVGGIPEYIKDDKTGLLFKNEDVDDLAEKLLLSASNSEMIQEIRRNSTKESLHYGWETFTNTYLDLYQEIINVHRKSSFNPWSELTNDLSKQMLHYKI
jgi:glycosyltransferase involved in cell wall biosynthesis